MLTDKERNWITSADERIARTNLRAMRRRLLKMKVPAEYIDRTMLYAYRLGAMTTQKEA